MSPTHARLAWAAVAWLACAAVLLGGAIGPAQAAERERPRLKQVKRSLVAVEEGLDEAKADLAELGPRLWTLESTVRRRHESVRDRLDDAALLRAMQMLEDVMSLVEAGTERSAVEDRMERLRRQVGGLESERKSLVDELEEIAERRLERRIARSWTSERVRRRVAAWTEAAAWSGLPAASGMAAYSADWEAIAECESSGRWHIDDRYDGGLQFDPVTWIEFGGGEFARYAWQASKQQQIAIAERVLAVQGPKAWPNCFVASA